MMAPAQFSAKSDFSSVGDPRRGFVYKGANGSLVPLSATAYVYDGLPELVPLYSALLAKYRASAQFACTGNYGAHLPTEAGVRTVSQPQIARTGLDYFRARYMSSAQGRFTSPDEPLVDQDVSNPQSWNLYSYVRNNPLRSIDPSGRKCVQTSNGQADDGTGGGCSAAGVDANGSIQAQQVNVQGQLSTWDHISYALDYLPMQFYGGFVDATMNNKPSGIVRSVAASTAGALLELPGRMAAGTGITTLGVAGGNGAVLSGARFAQRTASAVFSSDGKFAGRSVEEVANALRTGNLHPSDVPIEYIVRDGNTLILNTRSAMALEKAGIPRFSWNTINRTGDAAAEARLSGQLGRNGLSSAGIDVVK